jgi:ferrochelatase
VLLVNVGTPESPEVPAVRKYLAEFLSDPLVIRLPTGMGWFQGALGRLIAWSRAAHSAELYRKIWTDRGSPLKVIMEDQAAALDQALPAGWRVYMAMRYGRPTIAETLETIQAAGIEELVVIPMYPHFSRTTTGTVVRELYRALRQVGPHINVATRTTWYDDTGYIHAQARLIVEYATSHGLTPENTHLLFSAHGLPVSYVRSGDPYARHVERTIRLLRERLGWPAARASMAYQSRLGPAEWLKPDVRERLAELTAAGERTVLVCPVSFTVDCLETLEEIGQRYRTAFEADGGRFHLCPALNTYAPFVAALKNLVLHGPRPMTTKVTDSSPLVAANPQVEPTDGGLDSLVMIGASVRSRVGPGRGPRLRYSDPNGLCCVKKPQDEVYAFLQSIRRDGRAREALIWNTCQRFEFYGWLENPDDTVARECVVARLRRQLFETEPEGVSVNVFFGADAWHHLMRTIAGLNSGLPGDKDIVEQFQTAYRIAERAGTAGPMSRHLVDEAVTSACDVRKETSWGRLDPGYCYASLAQIHEHSGLNLPECRHAVIGGSTTSRSVIQTLHEKFDVQKSQMSLVYRNHHGGQIKLLRKAIGNGKRVRVSSYSEQAVIKTIAAADVVYFGIDRDEPILDAEAIRGIRDFSQRPLTIVDFNTFGSIRGAPDLDGVTVWNAQQLENEVTAFAEAMCAQPQFTSAVEEAEEWILRHTPESVAPRLKLPCTENGAGCPPHCQDCAVGRAG